MNRIRAAWHRRRAHRANTRAIAAQRRCCAGHCTTADNARVLAQRPPIRIPRQRHIEES